MTRNECELIAFYRSLYSSYLIEDDKMLFIKNNQFDNPIMSPCFIESDYSIKDCKDLLAQHSISWVYSFKPIINSILGNNQNLILSPFYVFEREKITCDKKSAIKFTSTYYEDLSCHELSEFTQALIKNTPSLSQEVHHKILNVLVSSNARLEFIIGRSHNSSIVAGVILVHGHRGTLLVNGFIDSDKRSSGLFKEFHAFSVNHALDSGQEFCFYWTFNEKLKFKKKEHLTVYVYEI